MPDPTGEEPASERIADHPVDPMFLERWSPRAFDPDAVIGEGAVLTILEAARWAPSAFNLQPWRFSYVLKSDARWSDALDTLIPFNSGWAGSASALLFVLSKSVMPDAKTGEMRPVPSCSFDTGAAWGFLSLQAGRMGWHCHAMTGFSVGGVRALLALDDELVVEAAVAIGRRVDPSELPAALRDRERPNGRRPLDELILR
jgi:nitroreductase